MKNAIIILVLGTCLGFLACSSVPTRKAVERDEDAFCATVAKARTLELEYGLNPQDGGEAGSR